jgi:uncharacterized protein
MNFAAILMVIVATCLLLLAAIYFFQDRLLYFPEYTTVERASEGGLRAWPSANNFRGLIAEPTAALRGTAIVFHGNAGHVAYRGSYADALVPLGMRVILAEYPGFGPRPGAVSESSLVADAVETVRLAHRQFAGPLLIVGESLGSAVAAAAAAQHAEHVTGLLLITPWDRLAHVAAHHYRWLPVKWVLRDQYDTVVNLAKFDRPVAVAVAENDRIVPSRFGVALHSALSGSKQLILIRSSNHNDWPDRVDANWWRSVLHFTIGETNLQEVTQ